MPIDITFMESDRQGRKGPACLIHSQKKRHTNPASDLAMVDKAARLGFEDSLLLLHLKVSGLDI